PMKAGLLSLVDRERWGCDPRPDLAADAGLWRVLLPAAYAIDGADPHGAFGVLHGLRCLGAGIAVVRGRPSLVAGEIDRMEYEELRRAYLWPRLGELRPLFAALAGSETV